MALNPFLVPKLGFHVETVPVSPCGTGIMGLEFCARVFLPLCVLGLREFWLLFAFIDLVDKYSFVLSSCAQSSAILSLGVQGDL